MARRAEIEGHIRQFLLRRYFCSERECIAVKLLYWPDWPFCRKRNVLVDLRLAILTGTIHDETAMIV